MGAHGGEALGDGSRERVIAVRAVNPCCYCFAAAATVVFLVPVLAPDAVAAEEK